LIMGKTHLNRSSRAVIGNFVHISANFRITLGKPPYVCAHYQIDLTYFASGVIDIYCRG